MKKNKKSITDGSAIIDFISDAVSMMIKPIQDRIVNQIEESVSQIISKITSVLVLSILSLVGLIFILLGFVFWISAVTGLGLWFGFFIVGIALFFSIAIAGAFLKRK